MSVRANKKIQVRIVQLGRGALSNGWNRVVRRDTLDTTLLNSQKGRIDVVSIPDHFLHCFQLSARK